MVVLGIAALARLFAWLLGGVVLRFGGFTLVLVGAIGLGISGDPWDALVAAIGAVFWLLGHAHYVVRRGVLKCRIPGWLWSSAGSVLSCLRSVVLRRAPARIGD